MEAPNTNDYMFTKSVQGVQALRRWLFSRKLVLTSMSAESVWEITGEQTKRTLRHLRYPVTSLGFLQHMEDKGLTQLRSIDIEDSGNLMVYSERRAVLQIITHVACNLRRFRVHGHHWSLLDLRKVVENSPLLEDLDVLCRYEDLGCFLTTLLTYCPRLRRLVLRDQTASAVLPQYSSMWTLLPKLEVFECADLRQQEHPLRSLFLGANVRNLNTAPFRCTRAREVIEFVEGRTLLSSRMLSHLLDHSSATLTSLTVSGRALRAPDLLRRCLRLTSLTLRSDNLSCLEVKQMFHGRTTLIHLALATSDLSASTMRFVLDYSPHLVRCTFTRLLNERIEGDVQQLIKDYPGVNVTICCGSA